MNEPENKPVEVVAETTEQDNTKHKYPAPVRVHPDNDTHATQWMRDAMDCVPYT